MLIERNIVVPPAFGVGLTSFCDISDVIYHRTKVLYEFQMEIGNQGCRLLSVSSLGPWNCDRSIEDVQTVPDSQLMG